MAVNIKKESSFPEYIEILNGLRKIQRKNDFKNVRLILNVDGSGKIQGFNIKGISYNQVRAFKNFDELLGILNDNYFTR